jgi:hypothetical protein
MFTVRYLTEELKLKVITLMDGEENVKRLKEIIVSQ